MRRAAPYCEILRADLGDQRCHQRPQRVPLSAASPVPRDPPGGADADLGDAVSRSGGRAARLLAPVARQVRDGEAPPRLGGVLRVSRLLHLLTANAALGACRPQTPSLSDVGGCQGRHHPPPRRCALGLGSSNPERPRTGTWSPAIPAIVGPSEAGGDTNVTATTAARPRRPCSATRPPTSSATFGGGPPALGPSSSRPHDQRAA
jgi:hypothetical protein